MYLTISIVIAAVKNALPERQRGTYSDGSALNS